MTLIGTTLMLLIIEHETVNVNVNVASTLPQGQNIYEEPCE